MGSDATSVGWVFQYALVDESGTNSTDELRTYQDWFLRYAVQSVPGVAEVATVGGRQRQYQVTIDPNVLSAYGVPLSRVAEAIRMSNEEVGGRLIELSGREYMVRGRGYLKSVKDIEQIVLKTNERGTPLTVGDVGRVSLGPEIRRGVADLDGEGDVVGGIVVMRSGENALNVIERVKQKLKDIEPSLPKGVKVVTTYDRSDLIERSIDTLKGKLIEEIIVVSIIILIFLWHVPSAIVPILTIPISVVLAFIPFGQLGLTINIMSLAGHRDLDRRPRRRRDRRGRERLQEAPALERRRAAGRLPQGAPRGAHGGRAVRLLLAPRHRRRVPSRLHARRPGGAPLQAARLLEEPRHGDRGVPRDHARPGAADALRADGLLPLPAEVARLGRQPGHRREVLRRGEAPGQRGSSTGSTSLPAGSS